MKKMVAILLIAAAALPCVAFAQTSGAVSGFDGFSARYAGPFAEGMGGYAWLEGKWVYGSEAELTEKFKQLNVDVELGGFAAEDAESQTDGALDEACSHVFSNWSRVDSFFAVNGHTAYLPGGNPVTCTVTTYFDLYLAPCAKGCGATGSQTVTTGESHSVSH